MKGRVFGIVGLVVVLLCWLSVFSRWSIFFLDTSPPDGSCRVTSVAVEQLPEIGSV
jgi:hypothetical protein